MLVGELPDNVSSDRERTSLVLALTHWGPVIQVGGCKAGGEQLADDKDWEERLHSDEEVTVRETNVSLNTILQMKPTDGFGLQGILSLQQPLASCRLPSPLP